MIMETIGEKIQEIRKRKGLTQEQLADSAKINLRTLQRIEKNETEPLGNTLKRICNILDINLEDILDYNKKEDNSYMIFFHLSGTLSLLTTGTVNRMGCATNAFCSYLLADGQQCASLNDSRPCGLYLSIADYP